MHDDDPEPLVRPELDALLDALRQPARPDELAGEKEAVAAMAAALASSRHEGIAPVPITKHTRKLAAVGVAAALIVGGVTAAAASVLTGSPNDNRVEIPAATTSSSSTSTSIEGTSTSTATTTAASTATSVDDHGRDEADDRDDDTTSTTVADTTSSTDDTTATTECEDNHGQTVSEIARETPPGPDHGQIVSAAARNHDCNGDTTATSAPDQATTPPTSEDDHGDDANRGRGHDDATNATTATTDDHGGDDHSGPGRSGSDNAADNSGSGSSGHGNSGRG